ncbi:zinc-binding metallopeptidase [Segatella copri]|uniref:zinc-binding metallopeptidase n=1 Tax=Segatella copri TaxID=165179 RepID=UPI003F719C6D
MKKYLLYALLAVSTGIALVSCSEDDLNAESVITIDKKQANDFDKWLTVNFVNPYNLEFKYRYEYKETDANYYTIPAELNQAIEMAHLVKYLCLESYDEVAGIDFTRNYFPKMIFTIGEWEYRNNGTIILGTAESGKKILLTGVNYLDTYKSSPAALNHYYFKTIHHEFTHILNQTKEYSAEFKLITGNSYVADSWSKEPFNVGYLERGFISAYAQHSDTEDFAEMMSLYVTNSKEQWDEWMAEAGENGAPLLQAKLDIVKRYMKDSWGIDMDKLRDTILRRQADLAAGKVDLTDISVK